MKNSESSYAKLYIYIVYLRFFNVLKARIKNSGPSKRSYAFKKNSHLVKSLFIRAKRICSKFIKFIYFGSIISNQLISRGYDKRSVEKIFTMVSKLDRESLLLYKHKKGINFENTFYLKINMIIIFVILKNLLIKLLIFLKKRI